MSHFSVAVITKGRPTPEAIQKALIPYKEGLDGLPEEYIKFCPIDDSYIEKYNNDSAERVMLKDGTLKHIYDVKENLEDIEAKIVNVPLKEIYSTFDEYIEKYCGYKKDEKTGEYGYWRNPNAKWDWYQVGGRWSGFILVKEKCTECGTADLFGFSEDDCYERRNGYKEVDYARVKDVETPHYKEDYEYAKRLWELYVEEQTPLNKDEEDMLKFEIIRKEYYRDTYKDKENYAKCEATFSTYALIDKDGNWITRGEVGWFGSSTEDADSVSEYYETFNKKVFEEAEDDDYITIVDCHI